MVKNRHLNKLNQKQTEEKRDKKNREEERGNDVNPQQYK